MITVGVHSLRLHRGSFKTYTAHVSSVAKLLQDCWT